MEGMGLLNQYKGKRVFLTGHTGFKGSWLLKWLHLLGAEVTGYSLAPLNKFDHYELINGSKLCNSIIGDIRDYNLLKQSILDCQPDFIFHLAARALVIDCYNNPREAFEVNTMGTVNVLDISRELDKEVNIIIVTTDKVYEDKDWEYWYRENDELGGSDPYSASKVCAEFVTRVYKKLNNQKLNNIAVTRAGNVFGGGDWSENRLIPDIARSFHQGKKLIIRSPKAIRPWQHVLEPLYGYLLVGIKMSEGPVNFSDSYNFGPNREDMISVNELIEKYKNILGSGVIEIIPNPHYNEANKLKLDTSKAQENLNWRSHWNLDIGLQKTIEWYSAFYNSNERTIDVTNHQIKEYQQLIENDRVLKNSRCQTN